MPSPTETWLGAAAVGAGVAVALGVGVGVAVGDGVAVGVGVAVGAGADVGGGVAVGSGAGVAPPQAMIPTIAKSSAPDKSLDIVNPSLSNLAQVGYTTPCRRKHNARNGKFPISVQPTPGGSLPQLEPSPPQKLAQQVKESGSIHLGGQHNRARLTGYCRLAPMVALGNSHCQRHRAHRYQWRVQG